MKQTNNDLGQPLIILGAPRSGTNILRDTLCSVDGISTWPCDEINYVWRYGNSRFPNDELTVDHAKEHVVHYIRNQFRWVLERYAADVVVEKTCANSLRPQFVHKVLPEAKFLFIYRNGVDATASASARWRGDVNIGYALKKMRFIPLTSLPYYLFEQATNRVSRLVSKSNQLSFWGPRFDGIQEAVDKYSLSEVCAIQWAECVNKTLDFLESIDSSKWLGISYEDFVTRPGPIMVDICNFLGRDIDDKKIDEIIENIRPTSVGIGVASLGKESVESIRKIINPSMIRLGYCA